MILADLNKEGAKRNHIYCTARSIWPIVTLTRKSIQEVDSHFSDLKNTVNNPTQKSKVVVLWISEFTWILADQKMALKQTHTVNQRKLVRVTRRFPEALKEDRRRRDRKAGEEIETLV